MAGKAPITIASINHDWEILIGGVIIDGIIHKLNNDIVLEEGQKKVLLILCEDIGIS